MDFSFSFKKPPSGSQPKKTNPFEQAEEQFNAIRGCGVTPRPSVTFNQLTEGQDPGSFDAAPYAHMLTLMGGADAEGEPFSDDVWAFNPQCITESGSYAALIANLSRIAKGALPLEDVSDLVDTDAGTATVIYTLDGEMASIDTTIGDGAAAPEVLSALAAIAASRGDGAHFASADHEGQRLIVFLTESDLSDLASTTSMDWTFIE